jgi:site-specific recombinase XerD
LIETTRPVLTLAHLARRGECPTLELAIAAWLQVLRASRSASTARTYAASFRYFRLYLESVGLAPDRTPTAVLTAEVIEGYFLWLNDRLGRKRNTLATYMQSVRSFLAYLCARGLGPPDGYENLRLRLRDLLGRAPPYKQPRVDGRLYEIVLLADRLPLPETGRDRARRRLEILRDRALLRTLFRTGARRAEVVSLNRDDCGDGWADQALVIGKGDKERVLFFDPDTLRAIREYLEARGDLYRPLLLQHNRGRGEPGPDGERWRLGVQSVWLTVRRYAELAGIRAKPHSFRHAFAGSMLNRGARAEHIAGLLGHADVSTTLKIYCQYDLRSLRAAYDQYAVTPEELAAEYAQSGDLDGRSGGK